LDRSVKEHRNREAQTRCLAAWAVARPKGQGESFFQDIAVRLGDPRLHDFLLPEEEPFFWFFYRRVVRLDVWVSTLGAGKIAAEHVDADNG